MARPEVDGARGAQLGVVVPTLDEELHLPRLLDDLTALGPGARVVVADGGSSDTTRSVARSWGATLVDAPRGRARQLNAGAAALATPWLLFLHADSRLTPAARAALEAWLRTASPGASAHFAFALEGDAWFWRLLEAGQRVRERALGLVYGDQGLVVSRETFGLVGGFPDVPLMEDVTMIDRLRRRGPVDRLPAALPTSPRRWEAEGRLRGLARNATLVALHRMGVPPARLAPFYRARSPS